MSQAPLLLSSKFLFLLSSCLLVHSSSSLGAEPEISLSSLSQSTTSTTTRSSPVFRCPETRCRLEGQKCRCGNFTFKVGSTVITRLPDLVSLLLLEPTLLGASASRRRRPVRPRTDRQASGSPFGPRRSCPSRSRAPARTIRQHSASVRL